MVGPSRTYGFGYRLGEVKLPVEPEQKEGSRISRIRPVDLEKRPPVAVSLGPIVPGVLLPHPDPQDPATLAAGVKKRVTIRPPKADPRLLREFNRFVRRWVKKHLVPLTPDSDISVETWLESTHYTRRRKTDLAKKWEQVGGLSGLQKKHRKCKSFMKDEHYPEYKHARSINSRTDEFKCAVGPIFKLIEKELFKMEYFIKKVPVKDRPAYILELLKREGAEYIATDYTAFEANFVRSLMENCEFELYRYMTSKLPGGRDFMNLIEEAMLGENELIFRNFKVKVPATRMSGEMCTSLGNSFSNLMIMLFMCKKHGVKKVKGVVEGDDGLFVGNGKFPTEQDFAKLGLMLKMEKHNELSTASFCGLIFAEEDRVNIADPYKVLAMFGWSTGRYARARDGKLKMLLRSKALSVAYQYPGCPVLQELAKYGLRVTRGSDVRPLLNDERLGWWNRQLLQDALDHPVINQPVGMSSRLLMEQKFGLSIEAQLRIEKLLSEKDDLAVLKLDLDFPNIWNSYYETYVAEYNSRDPDLDYPCHAFPSMC